MEGEHEHQALDNYFHDFVIPLAKEGEEIEKAKKLLGKDILKHKNQLNQLKKGKHVLIPTQDGNNIKHVKYEQDDDDIENPFVGRGRR